MRSFVHTSILTALLTGCIVEAPTGTSEAAKQGPAAQQRRAPAAPPIVQRIGANIENKVEIAAVTVVPGVLVPGETTRVSIAFKVLEDLKKDYEIFVHVEDADGKLERMNLDHKPNNGKTPMSEWKKGQTIADDFYLQLPPGVPLRAFNLLVGLWEPSSGARLKIVNPEEVRNDGSDRLFLVQIPVAQ